MRNGTIVPLNGTRLPATSVPGSIRVMILQSGMDQSGSAHTARNLSGSGYDTDKDWRARTMRYGEGWAHDPTYSHYKRAKPNYTDPEEDMKVDPSMPVGSTSKTYNPRTHEKYYSSVAGDTSEASTTMHNLGSINESEGDTVRAWSDKPVYRQ